MSGFMIGMVCKENKNKLEKEKITASKSSSSNVLISHSSFNYSSFKHSNSSMPTFASDSPLSLTHYIFAAHPRWQGARIKIHFLISKLKLIFLLWILCRFRSFLLSISSVSWVLLSVNLDKNLTLYGFLMFYFSLLAWIANL